MRAPFEVVGGEIIGDKAGMLLEHQDILEDVGLDIPPTIVVASETVRAQQAGSLNEATQEELKRICAKFETSPVLAIRSSAEGDGSGNGVYASRFASNVPELVVKEAGVVLNSFSTESAQDFRSQAGLGEEFALMIQPVVGQDLEATEYWEHFGPYLSGFGYSSSASHPNGYINVVAGIGGGVSRPGGQIITPEELDGILDKTILIKHFKEEGMPLSFHDFLKAVHEAVRSQLMDDYRNDFRNGNSFFPRELVQHEAAVAEYLIRKAGTIEYGYKFGGLLSAGIEEPTDEVDEKGRPRYEFVESEFLGVTKRFFPGKLLDALQAVELMTDYPVYVEWALDAADGPVVPIVLQIAPAHKTERTKLEAKIQGDTIAEARHIVGHGVKEANKIVVLNSPADIDHLHAFNRNPENEGYILIFNSVLLTPYSQITLSYSDCSKASAILELEADEPLHRHSTGDVVEHLIGSSRQTDKFIGEVTHTAGNIDEGLWDRVFTDGKKWQTEVSDSSMAKHGGVHFVEGKFKVLADESTGKFIIAEEP